MPREEGIVETGRTLPRHRNYFCESCKVRRAIGEPKPMDNWPSRLSLSQYDLDLLLLAAVEYALLSDEAGEYQSAIEFVDWVTPSALGEAA